jgi:invasion protein IalB
MRIREWWENKGTTMLNRIASPRPSGRVLTVAAAAAGLLAAALVAMPPALAQDKKPVPKSAPKQAPAAQKAAPAQQQQAQTPPQLMYSPWIKLCNKGKDTNNKKVCVLHKDGRLENGRPVVVAELIEPEGAPQKLLRVTVPLGVQLSRGTRVIIDQETPMTSQYSMCIPLGCFSDYPASDEMVTKLKKGKTLTVQAINFNNTAISLALPLADFAKAYDGPPTDPKAFEAQQRKLQSELQKKAEEARKKLEGQQPAFPPPEKKK